MYPGFAKAAREEGFAEVADWFETLAKAEKSHAGPLRQDAEDASPSDSRATSGDPARPRRACAGSFRVGPPRETPRT